VNTDRFPGENESGRPERVEDILRNSGNDFYKAFTLFFEREGVYGFGAFNSKGFMNVYRTAFPDHSPIASASSFR
jgi:hypothetical protein